ncbi:MAG: hypothetical protein EOO27_31795 [Comamonadaceae bacterium]|nr:MAG: hypothetical protein EOO27_31795 [Comamonadaceae bacterium]
MTAEITLAPCGECGMPCTPAEYHPYAACLMFKACYDSAIVRANLNAVRAQAAPQGPALVPLTDEQIDRVAEAMPEGLSGFLKSWGYRQFAREILALRAMPTWEPEFDCMTPGQEDLVMQFCQEIAGKRGAKGSPPDPVRLLEMAEALYKSEREAAHGITGAPNGKPT